MEGELQLEWLWDEEVDSSEDYRNERDRDAVSNDFRDIVSVQVN